MIGFCNQFYIRSCHPSFHSSSNLPHALAASRPHASMVQHTQSHSQVRKVFSFNSLLISYCTILLWNNIGKVTSIWKSLSIVKLQKQVCREKCHLCQRYSIDTLSPWALQFLEKSSIAISCFDVKILHLICVSL